MKTVFECVRDRERVSVCASGLGEYVRERERERGPLSQSLAEMRWTRGRLR